MSDKLKQHLDYIEDWLLNAPTQKHIETMTRFANTYDVNGDEIEVVTGTKQRVCNIWDTEAMIAEWPSIREHIEGPRK